MSTFFVDSRLFSARFDIFFHAPWSLKQAVYGLFVNETKNNQKYLASSLIISNFAQITDLINVNIE